MTAPVAKRPETEEQSEEASADAETPKAGTSVSKGESAPQKAQADESDEELAQLFGELWPLGKEVKLDPTVDRGRFRQQRDHLKANGYKFRPLDQVWVLD
jgi:hypothetical protein